MRVRAFAKINLSLRVLGRRPDGYHELRTVFQSIALHDTLTIRRTRGTLTFSCDDPDCPPDRDNLVWRAAVRVWRASGRRGAPRGVAIRLAKRIPIQAGLGGGSSDAAAVIRALGALWRVSVPRQQSIAAALGADIPYFFEGGTALGLERGDAIFPLVDRPPAWVVLVVPSFGVSTKEAFRWCDRDRATDLERPVGRRHPAIRRSITALRRLGASQAGLSGSGSAVFGLFARGDAAMDAAAALAGRGRRTIVTRTLDRRVYQRLAAT